MASETSTTNGSGRIDGAESAGWSPGVDAHLGARIRARRRMLRLTQEELATKIGVTAQQIHKYENGSNRVAASKLFEIATFLDLPIGALFDGLTLSPAADGAATTEDQVLLERQGLELAASFAAIREPHLRLVALRVVQAVADAQEHRQ